jgi:hypothetical protein
VLKKVSTNHGLAVDRSLLAAGEYKSCNQLHIDVGTFDQPRGKIEQLSKPQQVQSALEARGQAHVQPSQRKYQILAFHTNARHRLLPRSWTISKRETKRCRSFRACNLQHLRHVDTINASLTAVLFRRVSMPLAPPTSYLSPAGNIFLLSLSYKISLRSLRQETRRPRTQRQRDHRPHTGFFNLVQPWAYARPFFPTGVCPFVPSYLPSRPHPSACCPFRSFSVYLRSS